MAMTRTALTLVSPAPEALQVRADRLNAERQSIGREAVDDLLAALQRLEAAASTVACLDMITPGVRDLARRMAEQAPSQIANIQVLAGRPVKEK
jgi:hypothetical protein